MFVAVDGELGVIGFYSLNSFTLSLEDLPEEIARKLPRCDAIPTALIGRLARDERARGRAMGDLLLADAIRRILGAGRSIAVFAIVVDAKDERAAGFYKGVRLSAVSAAAEAALPPDGHRRRGFGQALAVGRGGREACRRSGSA